MIFTNMQGERFPVIEPVTRHEASTTAYCWRAVIRNIFGQREVVLAAASELTEVAS